MMDYEGAAPGFQFTVTPTTNGLLFTALNDAMAVPEPGSILLLSAGVILFLAARRR